jgi:hypothetical protein
MTWIKVVVANYNRSQSALFDGYSDNFFCPDKKNTHGVNSRLLPFERSVFIDFYKHLL